MIFLFIYFCACCDVFPDPRKLIMNTETKVEAKTGVRVIPAGKRKLGEKKKRIRDRRVPGAAERNLLCNVRPELFAQLKPELNPGVDLQKLKCGSGKIVTWTCCEHKTCNEHVWSANVANRSNGSGCPFCQTIRGRSGAGKRYCKCSRPSFLNPDGTQKGDVEMKRCSVKECMKELPITEFNIRADNPDGRAGYCRECAQKYTYFQDSVRSATMRLFFEGKKCEDCDETDTSVFECDHIHDNKSKKKDGNKIKNLIRNSRKNLASELAKCEVVCTFCHRLRSQSRATLDEEKVRDRYLENRDKLRNVKMEIGSCFQCQRVVTKENICAFDFDHLDVSNKVDCVSVLSQKQPWEVVAEEIAKCQLLCANCHRKKTVVQFGFRKLSDFPADVIKAAKEDMAEEFGDL